MRRKDYSGLEGYIWWKRRLQLACRGRASVREIEGIDLGRHSRLVFAARHPCCDLTSRRALGKGLAQGLFPWPVDVKKEGMGWRIG